MQCDAGSIREPRCRSTMSQHVPVSLRARTAADIIIVYIGRLRDGSCLCPFPFVHSCCVRAFLGEVWRLCALSAWYARAGRGVSSPLPVSSDPVSSKVVAACEKIAQLPYTLPHRQATGPAAASDIGTRIEWTNLEHVPQHALPASFGVHCSTCSVRIFGSVLRFIRRQMASQSG